MVARFICLSVTFLTLGALCSFGAQHSTAAVTKYFTSTMYAQFAGCEAYHARTLLVDGKQHGDAKFIDRGEFLTSRKQFYDLVLKIYGELVASGKDPVVLNEDFLASIETERDQEPSTDDTLYVLRDDFGRPGGAILGRIVVGIPESINRAGPLGQLPMPEQNRLSDESPHDPIVEGRKINLARLVTTTGKHAADQLIFAALSDLLPTQYWNEENGFLHPQLGGEDIPLIVRAYQQSHNLFMRRYQLKLHRTPEQLGAPGQYLLMGNARQVWLRTRKLLGIH